MNQPNDQWVIGVAPGKRRMNGLMMRRITKGNGTESQLVGELASCMNDHSHSHSRDDGRMALGLSQHGEASGGEEWVMMMERQGSALIYAVEKMSKHGADLSQVLNLESKLILILHPVDERVVGYQEGDDEMEA